MAERQPNGQVRGIVELIGEHPFATGLLAILGIIGFAISVLGFGYDRSETADSSRRLGEIETKIDESASDVEEVRVAVTSDCSGPPCWSLREFASWSTIGRPKDLIDRKLPPAERIEDGAYRYRLEDCWVTVEFTDGAVTYFSADLVGMKPIADPLPESGPRFEKISCDVDLRAMLGTNRPNIPSARDISVKQMVSALRGPDSDYMLPINLQIESACIDCGNWSEPFLEAVYPGAHVSNFVNVHFTTGMEPVDEVTGRDSYETWLAFRERMRSRAGLSTGEAVDTQDVCGLNIAPDIVSELGGARVERIGLSRGPRNWTNVLYCNRRS